jgi:hypothetical protein
MDQIELPVVKSDTTLKRALEVMRTRRRLGLITEQGGQLVVITCQEVVEELRKRGKDVALAEIEPGSPTVDASIDLAAQSFEHPATRLALDAAFASRSAEHAIISATGPSGRVVTVSERIAASLAQSFTVCTCQTDGTHVWFPYELTDPKKCEIDGDPVECT